MALSAFDDKNKQPGDPELAKALGKSFAAWKKLQELVVAEIDSVNFVWGFTSKSTGWGMRVKQADRVVFYMTPLKGSFLVSFALGEKAVKAAQTAGLPSSMLQAIDIARKYAEGRGVRFEIKSTKELTGITRLAEIKLAN